MCGLHMTHEIPKQVEPLPGIDCNVEDLAAYRRGGPFTDKWGLLYGIRTW